MTVMIRLAIVAALVWSATAGMAQVGLQPRPVSDKASFTIDGKPYQAAFTSTNSVDGIVVVVDAKNVRTIIRLDRYDEVLAALADRRLAPLWPTILDWAGPDLGHIRAQWLAAAKDKFQRPIKPALFDWMSDKEKAGQRRDAEVRSYSRYRDYARALFDGGDSARAFAVLDEAAALPPLESDRGYESGRIWITIASLKWEMGDSAGALATIARGRAALGGDAYAFVGNLDANAAYYLVSSGQYQPALTLFERFKAARPKGTLKSGELEWAGIEACALSGLGRAADADKAWRRVYDAAATGSKSLERTIFCPSAPMMAIRYFNRLLLDQHLIDIPALRLQPGRHGPQNERSVVDVVLRDPTVSAHFLATQRNLPAALWPALNRWRR